MIITGCASKLPASFERNKFPDIFLQGSKPMGNGNIVGYCYSLAHRASDNLLWMQGPGRYFRAVNGCRRIFWAHARDHGAGTT